MNLNNDAAAVANLTVQKHFAALWIELDPSATVHVIPTVQEAVDLVGDLSEDHRGTQVFVAGSFHLVGGVLSILEGDATPTGD